MKQVFQISFFAIMLLVIACKPSTAPAETSEDGKQYFGEKIEEIKPINMTELLAQMETQDTVAAQLKANVEAVCQTKGCWMNLVDASTEDASIFVKFKDYGFFMPKDIAGQVVVVRGIAYKEVTSVDELKHYAEDEGKTQEEIDAITEPVEELKFMADGVVLL
ncbi:MAG: DUF4920 domain-containing protein [Saprospiraceae bacterium]|nr:DUF4920 domain-containing protein [Saprospiraceae bacterium]